jgi:hypothetical protein
MYEEDALLQQPVHQPSYVVTPSGSGQTSARVFISPNILSSSSEIDPFRHETLQRPTVKIIVHSEVLKILGNLDKIPEIVTGYFTSIHHRITIVSKIRFFDRLPTLSTGADAEYLALCLCMYLLHEKPMPGVESMQSSLYITVKGIMSLLTSTGCRSLDVVQSLVLVTFYEIGHAIYPACSLSISSCAKLARRIGLHKNEPGKIVNNETARVEHEEKRRVWWAILNLER